MNATNEPRPRLHASPRARRALKRAGIDPARLKGSGPNGRILEADVLALSMQPTMERGHLVRTPLADDRSSRQVSTMRLAIARRTSESFARIPHFYLRAEVDVTNLVSLREQIVESIQKREQVRVTITDLLVRALSLALREVPAANCVWENDSVIAYKDANVGLVISLDEGLIIPVLGAADTLALPELARQRVALKSDGELRKRLAAQHAAISLSNLSASRVDEFDPVIPLGQSMILGVGRIAKRPFVVDGELSARETLRLSLALDHRVHDGAPGAAFLDSLAGLIENPCHLLI